MCPGALLPYIAAMVTVYEKTLVVDGLTPVAAYAALRKQAGDGSFLLESVVPGERWGRYSVLGYRPKSQLILHGEPGVDPFARLTELLGRDDVEPASVAARFARAHIGMVAYDIVHYATKVDPWPSGARRGPLARLVSDSTVIVFDNLSHTATIASTDPSAVEEAAALLGRVPPLAPMLPPDPQSLPEDVEVDTPDSEFGANVERIKEYIRAGDAFQVVLARTFSTPTGGADPFDVYRSLCVLSPAPYMYLLEFPEREDAPRVAIAGASPETLIRVENRRIASRPIAGTRRRGRTPEEDEALAAEMLADPKERAEHVMLIDLARNDLGRVAAPGSVRIPQRMAVHRFSQDRKSVV